MGYRGSLALGSLNFECQVFSSGLWDHQLPDIKAVGSWTVLVLMFELQSPACGRNLIP